MPARVDRLTSEQEARMDGWADRWIGVGLRTGSADRERFESAVVECYGFAGLVPPRRVVWVSSPLVLALAAPTAASILDGGAVNDAVAGAVHDAVAGAVHGAVHGAVDGAVDDAVDDAVRKNWHRYIGGQFWAGGWWRGPAYTSYFREVCDLQLSGDMWDRARAYETTVESACWWWPHREFVMVCERPTVIHRELVDPGRPRGWGSHRLHRDDGPAVAWPDGWGVYAIHGVRVPAKVVEAPDTLTVAEINSEPNAEVRRVMIDRFGPDRYLRGSDAALVDDDPEWGRLWRLDQDEDEPLVMVEVVNSSPEPDGSSKTYWLRVPPASRSAHEAVAWTFDMPADEYDPAVQT